uniref:Uncharacterized protein n=1 Tax=Buteo japonicus TaxID=224669 RepID=A0A8C0HKW9_9AVES
MTAKNVGVTSTNGDLKGFIDQNQSSAKGNISIITLPVSSTNSPTKILPKTLGPINVNVGPQMIIKRKNLKGLGYQKCVSEFCRQFCNTVVKSVHLIRVNINNARAT